MCGGVCGVYGGMGGVWMCVCEGVYVVVCVDGVWWYGWSVDVCGVYGGMGGVWMCVSVCVGVYKVVWMECGCVWDVRETYNN